MKATVLYASRGGNTGKIAGEIASELRCEATMVVRSDGADSADLESFDLIFVGTGVHYGNPNEDLVRYLENTSLKTPKVFALFVTWGGAGKTNQSVIAKLRTILSSQGHRVVEDCYVCYGGWNLLRRGHPNAADAMAARKWAKKIAHNFN